MSGKPRLTRREFCLLATALALGVSGCSVAHASPATPNPTTPVAPEGELTATPTPTPRPTATPSPTPLPATAIASIKPRVVDASQMPSPQRLPPERIIIPRIGIDSKIVLINTKLDADGQRVWETAAFAVGHHRGSANPGERGNVVLSGHVSSVHEGAVFNHLPQVVVGDAVVLSTAEQDYLYRVTQLQTVTPDHVEALQQTPDETLTLITCVPDGVYTHRLIVTAKRVSPTSATTAAGAKQATP